MKRASSVGNEIVKGACLCLVFFAALCLTPKQSSNLSSILLNGAGWGLPAEAQVFPQSPKSPLLSAQNALYEKNWRTQLAAIRSLSQIPNAWTLLPDLVKLAQAADFRLANSAALAASMLMESFDLSTQAYNEVSQHTLAQWHSDWGKLAAKKEVNLSIRILALEVCLALSPLVQDAPNSASLDWQAFLVDTDPEFRRASLSLAPKESSLAPSVKTILTSATADDLALQAGRWLCGPLGANSQPSLPSERILARLAELAQKRNFSIAARSDLAPCLAHSQAPQSKKALRTLLNQAPPYLRKSIVELTKP